MSQLDTVVMVPQRVELAPLVRGFADLGYAGNPSTIGRLDCLLIERLGLVMTVGGHGKVQMAVQTQHLIERLPGSPGLVICAGAAGRLCDELALGDVVVGTCCVEHDYKLRFVRRPAPRHDPHALTVARVRALAGRLDSKFTVHFGPIASGDEDVVDSARAAQIRDETGAICVAWEGSGAARAAAFNGVPFLEVRAITDGADTTAASDFHANLELAMPNVAAVLVASVREWTHAVAVGIESPRQPDVMRLIAELDAYQTSLYPAESNHLLDVEALAAPSVRFVVARRDGEALACGALRVDDAGYGEVKRMYVVPAARGTRLGRRILRVLEEEGRRAGVACLRLETGIHQAAAIALYRSEGYVERPPFGEYQPDPLSLFMEKKLGEKAR